MGDYYLSVLTFRQTEFEETPVVPLLFMIHERRIESVHDYFFKRLLDLLPDVSTCKRLVIVSDEETAIVNAIRNNLPGVPRFRCWLHALGNIKEKLRKLGISERSEVKEYKIDFINLLNSDSEAEYKAALTQLYITKWNKVSSSRSTFKQRLDFIPISITSNSPAISTKTLTLIWETWVHGSCALLEFYC